MPSLFASLAAAASATVDAVFAEGFVLLPAEAPIGPGGQRRDPNARRVASATRPGLRFRGVFIAEGAMLHAHGRSMADSTTRPVVAEKPMIEIDVNVLPERPRQGDRITRDDTGEVFEVTRYVPEDFGRAWIHLAERRRADGATP